MISFLLIISFLLHVIGMAAIYKLYQQLASLKTQDAKEIEGLFEAYLQEIRNENRRLQDQLLTAEKNSETIKDSSESAASQETIATDVKEEFSEPYAAGDGPEDILEASLESRVLQLHSEGLSQNDIARRLNCGKTEVEIILKLHSQPSNQ
ncbi:DUF6115 domain-containing protein [Oceanobacillus damuensis]|uniref:DUF6115 domain-containing protein n=1 Tax=Oceanobacillus damuensis TaxID=937928 RepID=UPI000830D86B|nr:hypothetical protein [Oceanobacillus damuensis]